MIKAIFIIDNLNIGGVATALYNCLSHTSELMDISLMVFDPETIDRNRISDKICLVTPSEKVSILARTQEQCMNESKVRGLFRLALVLISRIFGGKIARNILFSMMPIYGEYDLAISYVHDVSRKSLTPGCNDFVLSRVKAKKKMAVIHCDYENFGGYDPKQLEQFSKFDYIAGVSGSCVKKFLKMFPSLKEKCIKMENFADENIVDINNNDTLQFDKSKVNFVTVCRLTEEKGLLRAFDVFKKIAETGTENFTWTIIGDGPLMGELQKTISDTSMEDKIFLLGAKTNPFTYICEATAFLLPSFHEAAPMVFSESALIGLPVISTETCSAKELVEDAGIGLVCENTSDGLETVLRMIIDDPSILNKFRSTQIDNVNVRALNDIHALINKVLDEVEEE